MNEARRCLLAACCVCVFLAACGGQATRWDPSAGTASGARVYVVQRGDTLYAIAFRHGLDWRELARWNGLGSGDLIYPGQRLRLYPPSAAATRTATDRAPAPPPSQRPAASARADPPRPRDPSPTWAWPTHGAVVYRFGDSGALGRGLGVSGRLGQPVVAAAPGRVVYTGSGLVGYGELIIIKHNNTYLSAYGHTRSAQVGEGEEVRAGQRIAAMGEGPGARALLHFEIRIDGEPVDPLALLPPR